MSTVERIITIAAIVAGTMLTRFLPFIIFKSDKPTPKYIQYLGKMLPMAVFSMLLIYCLRHISVFEGSRGIPEFLGIAVTTLLHIFKRQMLISIAGGTIFYMIIVQKFF